MRLPLPKINEFCAMRTSLAILALGSLLWCQKKQKETNAPMPPAAKVDSTAIKIYQQAVQYNDPLIKIYALHYRIATEGASFGLLDSLAQAYFEAGFYRQAIMVVDEILPQQPRNATLAEIKALSYYYLQDFKKAIEAYEKLYEITNEPLHLYQVVTLQFNLQRYGECQANIDRLLNLPESAQARVRITTPEGQTQEIPLRAAAYNVRGVIYRLQKDYPKAKEAFEKALQVAPEFLLAKGNLEDMQKELSAQPPGKKN
jgi:tetratricopeptide (TPR) repeat protein